MSVEDMLTLFLVFMGIIFAATYAKYNLKYLIGVNKTDNVFLRGVIQLILALLIMLATLSFGRILEVMGYADPVFLVSKVRRSLYIVSLIYIVYALIMLCITTKPNKP
ncbi:hypothetical protein [Paenibacillus kandeliae]|uniref:hypothetical protein n=1 Tax=Paenibacillus kandeliae TaxID=3231269 RepID=UPI003457E07E